MEQGEPLITIVTPFVDRTAHASALCHEGAVIPGVAVTPHQTHFAAGKDCAHSRRRLSCFLKDKQ